MQVIVAYVKLLLNNGMLHMLGISVTNRLFEVKYVARN